MGFNAEISPRALRDLDEVAAELKERSQSYTVAPKWFLAVVDAIDSLAEDARAVPVVTEGQDEIECVRVLLHGKRNRRYRFITVCENSVLPVERSASSTCGTGHGKVSAKMNYKYSSTRANEM